MRIMDIAGTVFKIEDGIVYITFPALGTGGRISFPKERIPFDVEVGERILCKIDDDATTTKDLNFHDWKRSGNART
jgi:hypothetical protein